MTPGAPTNGWDSGSVVVQTDSAVINAFEVARNNNDPYASTGAVLSPNFNSVFSNSWNFNNNSALLGFRLNNLTPVTQTAYFGAVSVTGSGLSPALVWGQTTGASSYVERMRINSTGNVGIGTTGPTAKLDVVGAIRTPTVSIAAGTTTIDTATSNTFSVAFTSNVCAALTLNNVLDGASYTFAATGVTSGTCSFVVSGATVKYYPANAAVTADAVYTLLRVGNVVYVSWISGFI